MCFVLFVDWRGCCCCPHRFVVQRLECQELFRGYLPIDVDDLVPRESGTAQTRGRWTSRRYVTRHWSNIKNQLCRGYQCTTTSLESSSSSGLPLSLYLFYLLMMVAILKQITPLFFPRFSRSSVLTLVTCCRFFFW